MSPICVTLLSEVDSLWRSCFQLEHEMIITNNGRRIFPAMKYSVTDLDPNKMYIMRFHLDYVDNKKLRFVSGTWVESLSTEKKDPPRKVWHHEGPQTGKTWMARNISFDQIRITKRKSKEDENPSNVHLHTLHRYIPVLTIYEGDELVHTASIPHTQFITVSSYHKPSILDLKIDNNKYATAYRKNRGHDSEHQSSLNNSSSENSASSPPLKRMKKKISTPLKTIEKEDMPTYTTPLPQFFTPSGQLDSHMLQTLLFPQCAPENASCVPLSVKKEDLPTVDIPTQNVPYSATDFKTLQELLLSQCAAKNIPGLPLPVKKEELPTINIPTSNIPFPTLDFQMLQSMLAPQLNFFTNPFFNPFLNPCFTPLFPTPSVSPIGSEIEGISNNTETTDKNIDIV